MASILLGVTGSIAAYKACALASRLVQRGDLLDVIMTEEAMRFITPLSFAAITGRQVWSSLWEEPAAIPHITLVRVAEVFVIAPATAQTLARLALGIADDVLTNAALAARIPIIIAPAMNAAMYEHPATVGHLALLRSRGVIIVEPEYGFLAEREQGLGRLASQDTIIEAIDRVVTRQRSLQGVRVFITAGPTREAIDPVRFISSAASGATGIACAAEAYRRGAKVRLVLGPTHLHLPVGIEVCRVTTAAQMLEASIHSGWDIPDIIIAAAAVADERPVHCSEQKLKKCDGALRMIPVTATEDIVARLRDRYPHAYIVGFAAETQEHLANAREKLNRKRLDAIIVNDVMDGRGFGIRENTWTFLTKDQSIEVPLMEKSVLASRLWDVLESLVVS